MPWSDIEHRHAELQQKRQREEGHWRDIARIISPDDEFNVSSQTQRNGMDCFDSSPLYAKDDFADGLFTQATNPALNWFDIGILGDEDLAAWGPVREYTSVCSRTLSASLSPSISGFYTAITACFADTGAFGNASLYQDEWYGRQTIIDRAIPLGESYIDVDAAGRVDTKHREFMLTGRQIKGWFGDRYSDPRLKDDQSYKIVQAVSPNLEMRPGMIGPRGMAFRSLHVSPDLKNMHIEGGYHELPFSIFQWNGRSGSPWSKGPGHNARADMNSLNEMERSHLVAAQFNAEPPILLHDESVLTAADIAPNALLYGTMTDQGKPMMQVLDRGQRVQLSEAKAEQKRQAIREAFHFNLMSLMNRPEMTASEFLGWEQKMLERMGSKLVRIQSGLAHFIGRRFRILERAGQLPPPPEELLRSGRTLEVVFVSPLAKAQKAAKAREALGLAQSAAQLTVIDPEVVDNIDADGVLRVVAEGTTSDPRLMRSPEAVAEIRQRRAQAAAETAELEKAAQATTIMAEASHAQQAATLAAKRGGQGG